jgi:hypothetical protein
MAVAKSLRCLRCLRYEIDSGGEKLFSCHEHRVDDDLKVEVTFPAMPKMTNIPLP